MRPRSLYSRVFGELGGSIFALAGANILAQVLNVGFIPVLTRLYGPADFGIFAAYGALVSILAVGVALRYDMALPLASGEREAVNLTFLAFFLVVVMSFATGLLFLLGGDRLIFLLGAEHLVDYLWLIPLGLLLTGLQQVFVSWMSLMRNFRALAVNRIIQALLQGVLQVGLSRLGVVGLLLGFVFGRVVGVVALCRYLLFRRKLLHPALWVRLAYSYRAFPLFNLPAAFLDTFGLQMVPIMFARLFSAESAGFYSVAVRVVALPSILFGQAVAQVLYPEASRQRNREQALSSLVASMATTLLWFGTPLFGWLFLCSPTIFVWVFGREWREAGVYASYLSVWLLLNFVSSPLSSIPLVKGQQRKAFYFTLYETTLRLLAVWVGLYLREPRYAVISYALAGAVISLVYLIWVFRLAGASFPRWVGFNAKGLVVFLLVLVVLYELRSVISEEIFVIGATAGMGLLGVVSWWKWGVRRYV